MDKIIFSQIIVYEKDKFKFYEISARIMKHIRFQRKRHCHHFMGELNSLLTSLQGISDKLRILIATQGTNW
ncbi:hypothetical protein C0J52_11487 [Blattella germanica]|nr:hypothetical protein C0J52_11487 [Blattella germanica]